MATSIRHGGRPVGDNWDRSKAQRRVLRALFQGA